MPGQPFAEGVTVIVATIIVVPELETVNEGIFPFPLAPSPIAMLLLVQENVVPGVGLVKFEAGTRTSLHAMILAGTTTIGAGFTVIV